jgi:alanine racemase
MLYQTQARIHLGHIRTNLEAIRQIIGPRKLLLSVKANAYGHGAVAVSHLAEACGVDWLGVATVPEGLQLRDAGISLPILKMSPTFPQEMGAAVAASLTLALSDGEGIRALEAACTDQDLRSRVHLKIETGMGRTGAPVWEAPELARFIERECPHLHLEGVFTHLPVSDEPDSTAYTRAQVQVFQDAVVQMEAALGHRPELVHCANSGGVLGHPDSWLDLVRAGIMAYGSYPDAQTPRTVSLLPGLSFVTRVAHLKRVETGTTIGYGRTWTAQAPTWIATICCGYADGFNRLFSNRGRVLIGGRSYPVVGRVCMDQTMVDLGPATDVKVGDEVVLIGRSGEQEITAADWAQALGTIPYEVTCQIGARVERVPDPA